MSNPKWTQWLIKRTERKGGGREQERKEGEKQDKGEMKERLERAGGVVESKGGYNLNVYI